MDKTKISDVVNFYKQQNNIDTNSVLAKELSVTVSRLASKKIFTIKELESKGPALLVKAFPGLSINRINLLYQALGKDIPFIYTDCVIIKSVKKFVLSKKYK